MVHVDLKSMVKLRIMTVNEVKRLISMLNVTLKEYQDFHDEIYKNTPLSNEDARIDLETIIGNILGTREKLEKLLIDIEENGNTKKNATRRGDRTIDPLQLGAGN